MKNILMTSLFFCASLFFTFSGFGADYGITNNQVYFNNPDATDYVICFIGQDGTDLGGIFMNKTNSSFSLGLDHPHIQANKNWNQYKFVYMTATGQKETNWIPKDNGPPSNNAPIAGDDNAITNKEKPVNIFVLANDSDPDGDTLSIIGISNPANGTVENNTNSITYTPESGFVGNDSFTYTVSDGKGKNASATVNITVQNSTIGDSGYGITNNQVWFNLSAATDYVIFFIGRDGANLGGVFMDKTNSGFSLGLDHGHLQANKGWNQYKFVYMTASGQKETDWIAYNDNPTDTTPPSIPTGLTSSNVTENSLNLSWNEASDDTGVTGYKVFMDNNLYQTVSGTNLAISNLSPDTNYNFQVKAFDAAGNISALSGQLTVRTAKSTNDNPNLFPVRIVNTSGRPDDQVYIAFIGRLPENENQHIMAHLNFETSELVPIKLSDNDPGNYNKCKYYTKLSNLDYISDNVYTFNIPRVASARMYISVDKPVYFHVNEEPAGLAEPNVLSETEEKSGYDTIYDIIEITWLHDQDLFVNTSNVDFLSIPFKIQMNLKDGSKIVRGYDIPRNDIFAMAEAMGEPWSKNIVRNDQGFPLRLLGGTLGTVAGNIPEDYLTPAIDNAWKHFKTNPVFTNFEGWTIENGYVNNNNELNVTASHDAYGNETFTIAKPTSREGFASEGALANGSIIERKIQVFIGAAINRGVLQNPEFWWNWNAYYQDTNSNKGLYNKYSELLHAVSIEGRCYGFSYDDVNGFDSSIWLPNEKELIITIPKI